MGAGLILPSDPAGTRGPRRKQSPRRDSSWGPMHFRTPEHSWADGTHRREAQDPAELTAKGRPEASFELFFRHEFAQLYRALVIFGRGGGPGAGGVRAPLGAVGARVGGGRSSGLPLQNRLERILPTSPEDSSARQTLPWNVVLRLRERPSLIGGGPGSHRAEPADASRAERAALVVTELLGHDSGEGATILGIRPGTVRTLVSQAKARLRDRKEEQ